MSVFPTYKKICQKHGKDQITSMFFLKIIYHQITCNWLSYLQLKGSHMQMKYLTIIEPENIADWSSVAVLNGQVFIHLHQSILFEDTAMSMTAIRVT